MTCAGAIGKFAKPEGEGRRIRVADTTLSGQCFIGSVDGLEDGGFWSELARHLISSTHGGAGGQTITANQCCDL
jgi:hypothetical protein